MSRRKKTTCGLYDVEHIGECELNEELQSCECGCDVDGSCVTWNDYRIALDKEYPPEKPTKRRRRTTRCPF